MVRLEGEEYFMSETASQKEAAGLDVREQVSKTAYRAEAGSG